MHFLSGVLRRAVYPRLAKAGFFRFWRKTLMNGGVSVITYHGLLPAGYQAEDSPLDGPMVHAAVFRQHLHLLKRRYNVLSPEEFFSCLRSDRGYPSDSILLTCDDGLLNHLTEMMPILREEGLSCLFFVTTEALSNRAMLLWYQELFLLLKWAEDKQKYPLDRAKTLKSIHGEMGKTCAQMWWPLVKELSSFDPKRRRAFITHLQQEVGLGEDWKRPILEDPVLRRRFVSLSAEDLESLGRGGMKIGSHTCTHPILTRLTDQWVWKELERSRKNLEQVSGERVWALAYPFGDPASVGSREGFFAQSAGYQCAFINYGGLTSKRKTLPFCMPRVHVNGGMTPAELEAHASGFHGWLQKNIRPFHAEAGANRSMRYD